MIKGRLIQTLLTIGFISSTIYMTYGFFNIKDYPNLSASRSQWEIYHHLVNSKHYCIPVNPYSWSMNYHCKELAIIQSKKQPLIPLPESLEKHWKVQNVVVYQVSLIYPEHLWLVAYDQDQHEMGRASQITPPQNDYQYFLFKEEVSPAYFSLVDSKGTPFSADLRLELYGGN